MSDVVSTCAALATSWPQTVRKRDAAASDADGSDVVNEELAAAHFSQVHGRAASRLRTRGSQLQGGSTAAASAMSTAEAGTLAAGRSLRANEKNLGN